jgi:hypothetical protein
MGAEDHTEPFAIDPQTPSALAEGEGRIALTAEVTDWLGRRTETTDDGASILVAVQSGRWLLRVELGATASTIDVPARVDASASEVAAAVRRWARTAGFGARTEALRAVESRVVLTPPTPTRS